MYAVAAGGKFVAGREDSTLDVLASLGIVLNAEIDAGGVFALLKVFASTWLRLAVMVSLML